MRIIYEPRGRALEYAPLAVSLYRGCSHGCVYCFAPDVIHTDREKFLQATPRKNAIPMLKADAAELAAAGDQREILMSFTTDPYQPIEQQYRLTSTAIGILINSGLHFSILTKAGIPSLVDLERLKKHPDLCRYGTTLTFDNPADSREFEPYAALPHERITALTRAHDSGIRTWVSLEPVIYPEQTLRLIEFTLDLVHKKPGIVDEYRIGKINHVENDISDHEWIRFVKDAKTILDEHHCRYIFKKDLQPYLPGGNR